MLAPPSTPRVPLISSVQCTEYLLPRTLLAHLASVKRLGPLTAPLNALGLRRELVGAEAWVRAGYQKVLTCAEVSHVQGGPSWLAESA